MIRTLLSLIPAERRGAVIRYTSLALLSVVLRAAGVVLLVPLVDALFSAAPQEALPWLGALTAVTIAGWAADAAAVRIGYGLGFALLGHALHDVADRLTRVRLTWYTADNTALARQAIATAGPELIGLIAYLLTPLIGALLLPAALGLALLAVAWPLGLAALAGVPVLLGALWASGRISRRADEIAAHDNTVLTERIVEFARIQQALRAARRAELARSQAGAALAAQHGATVRLLRMQIPGHLLFSLAGQLALILLAGTTTVLVTSGAIGVPEAIALIVVIVFYLEPFTTLGELSSTIEPVRAALGRIRAVLDAPAPTPGTASPRLRETPRIELQDVSFRYGDGPAVLDGLSVTFEPGQATAIVGPSGSGKSTILALVAGLHEPTTGRVLIDGIDAATLTPDARRAIASVVFQHPYLFDASIRDNILAGDPAASGERLTHALHAARLDELVRKLPDGADRAVGEAGTALSGGERQRVSIARALLKPAPVLLIDEATSALDTENEAAVVRAIADEAHRRTRLIVAHRLSTIRSADRVIFIDAGRIVEDGTVGELVAADGRFFEFWRQQHDAAGWRVGAPPPDARADR
ncbi:ABC transporter ATP-binding protein [Nonomuraea fuscirosea]|uniref:ABC transporter ATP-binding protein n=1 Tax=Nonomuraea fuscirosea TaxID=1291556 RepID=UPI00344A516E